MVEGVQQGFEKAKQNNISCIIMQYLSRLSTEDNMLLAADISGMVNYYEMGATVQLVFF